MVDCSIPRSNKSARAFSLGARLRSFAYAGRGILTMVRSQHNTRVHVVATLCVVALGLSLRIPRLELSVLVLAIASVWTSEAINTSIEFLCDVVSPDFHPLVEKAKDVAAGGVLVCAIGAAATGALVLGPPLAAIFF